MKQVLKDRLLIEKIKLEKQNSIIDIVEDENGPITGKVLQVGKLVEDIKTEDIVLFKETDSLPISIEDKNYLILREYDIIAII